MLKLIRCKTVRRPTLAGWILILVLGAGALRLLAPALHRFLAVSDSPSGSGLIVEGWIHDAHLEEVLVLIRERNYPAIYCTGVPIEIGGWLTEYRTWAEVGAERLARAGIPRERIVAVSAAAVLKDRTQASALALRNYLAERPEGVSGEFDLATSSVHARRSRLIFRRILGPNARVRVIAIQDPRAPETGWWRSSEGFRTVLYECLAYGYTRVWIWTGGLDAPPDGSPRCGQQNPRDPAHAVSDHRRFSVFRVIEPLCGKGGRIASHSHRGRLSCPFAWATVA